MDISGQSSSIRRAIVTYRYKLVQQHRERVGEPSDKRGRVGWLRLRCDRTMLCWRPCRATEGRAHEVATRCHHGSGSARARIERANTRGVNDMRTTWCVALFAASAMMGTLDVLYAQSEENPGRNEFLRSCASCHGVSGKGDGPVAKSLSSPPSDLTRLSEANNGVYPISRVHEVIDGRIERLVHGTRDMPVWGDRYMREMTSPESGGWVSKEWDEAIVRRRILALVEYISTLQRAARRSR